MSSRSSITILLPSTSIESNKFAILFYAFYCSVVSAISNCIVHTASDNVENVLHL